LPDVGNVARELIRRQPQWLRDSLFPTGSELVAAAHDLAKSALIFRKRFILPQVSAWALARQSWTLHLAATPLSVKIV